MQAVGIDVQQNQSSEPLREDQRTRENFLLQGWKRLDGVGSIVRVRVGLAVCQFHGDVCVLAKNKEVLQRHGDQQAEADGAGYESPAQQGSQRQIDSEVADNIEDKQAPFSRPGKDLPQTREIPIIIQSVECGGQWNP